MCAILHCQHRGCNMYACHRNNPTLNVTDAKSSYGQATYALLCCAPLVTATPLPLPLPLPRPLPLLCPFLTATPLPLPMPLPLPPLPLPLPLPLLCPLVTATPLPLPPPLPRPLPLLCPLLTATPLPLPLPPPPLPLPLSLPYRMSRTWPSPFAWPLLVAVPCTPIPLDSAGTWACTVDQASAVRRRLDCGARETTPKCVNPPRTASYRNLDFTYNKVRPILVQQLHDLPLIQRVRGRQRRIAVVVADGVLGTDFEQPANDR